MPDSTAPTESKALRLARYLRGFVGLNTTTVRHIEKYESVLWFGEMPQETDCRSPAWIDECEPGEPWLEVRRQHFPKSPSPPGVILPWVSEQALLKASEVMPPLNDVAWFPDESAEIGPDEEPPLVQHHLRDHPEVSRAYEQFRPKWEAWSSEYRRREHIQNVYAELFRFHTQLRKQSEIVEVVFGLGLLDWSCPAKNKAIAVRRHVVTAQVDLTFNPGQGIIRLECPADGAQLHIEDDMLEAEHRPDRDYYASVGEQLVEIGDCIWDRSLLFSALKSWAGALHPDSQWSPELSPERARNNMPHITFAPALILRKRSQRGMVRIYDLLIEKLNSEADKVPSGWGGLVEDGDDRDDDNSWSQTEEDKGASDLDAGTVYFPLLANREQRKIVEAIEQRRGVLVQGPPGTGKTHTIANLVCHLLAKGKRVLITAETARALQVLKKQLPPEIQPLCVSLLGQGGDAFAELNACVQAITTKYASWSPGAYTDRIKAVDHELDEARRELARVDSELRGLRKDETCPHVLLDGVYQGTASTIAQRVTEERERFGWLQIPNEALEHPPLNNEQATNWLRICRSYSEEDIAEAKLQIVPSEDLPEPTVFASAVHAEKESHTEMDQFAEICSHPAYAPIMACSNHERDALKREFQEIEKVRKEINRAQKTWTSKVAGATLSGQDAIWTQLWRDTKQLLESIEENRTLLGTAAISLPVERERSIVRAHLQQAQEHLDSGGKWTRFVLFTPKAIKACSYLRDEIMVDGQGASTSEQLALAAAYLDMEQALDDLSAKWTVLGGLPDVTDMQLRYAAVKEMGISLAGTLNWARRCVKCARQMAEMSKPIPEPAWLDGECREWLDILNATSTEERYRHARAKVESPLGTLRATATLHDCHPVLSELASAVRERDIPRYSKSIEDLQNIEKTRCDQTTRTEAEKLLEACVPGLIDTVHASTSDTEWDDRLGTLIESWHWAYADNWLRKRTDIAFQQKLCQQHHDIERKIAQYLAEAAALRAWTYFFERLSFRAAAALKGWREAVKALGKGTGRSARVERIRREVRTYMEECRKAIPVWIMPRFLVAEMVEEPAPGLYDVVIVDEASQLGIESLFLFYIAKKMVVVGDAQQISPYGIGIRDEDIAGLQEHYLRGIPHRVALSAQSSLYGNADIRFGQKIVLREHFRCMPEIIQFSNDLCYASNGTPLDPLRTYSANRLQPIVTRHVPDGYRTGSKQNALNEPEADAVVAQILACIDDSRYADKSMGVVSLQGKAQAKLIERKLLQVLEPEIIEERRIICGDAYAFQGDERNVMFMSMVAAANMRIGTLSNDSACQRFNVATSRAQDQLWLFHSATLDILSDRCMRHRLLSYMLNPGRAIEESSIEAERAKCESQLERDMFDAIVARKFHIRTQVVVGDPTNHRYRIDLVVEGMKGRLAVECDGDQWHGPDRYEQDMARQRDLERAGWQFVRIRGGDFYRDNDEALKPLWKELDRLGIRPGGIDKSAAAPPAPMPQGISGDTETNSDTQQNTLSDDDGDPVESKLSTTQPWSLKDGPAPQPKLWGRDTEGGQSSDLPVESQSEAAIGKSADHKRSETGEAVSDEAESVSFPDPRTGKPWEVEAGLKQVLSEHGPLPCHYAYRLYIRQAGFRKVSKRVEEVLSRCMKSIATRGEIKLANEYGNSELRDKIASLVGAAPVRLRPRGARNIEDIPPSELAEAMRTLEATGEIAGQDEEEVFRKTLDYFNLKRLTKKTREILMVALEIYTNKDALLPENGSTLNENL